LFAHFFDDFVFVRFRLCIFFDDYVFVRFRHTEELEDKLGRLMQSGLKRTKSFKKTESQTIKIKGKLDRLIGEGTSKRKSFAGMS
jgi:hypothetical protein